MSFEEQLYNLNEEEIFGKEEAQVVEGSDLLKHLAYLGKLLGEVADAITARETMLKEDMQIIDQAQIEAIRQLGEILDTINNR